MGHEQMGMGMGMDGKEKESRSNEDHRICSERKKKADDARML